MSETVFSEFFQFKTDQKLLMVNPLPYNAAFRRTKDIIAVENIVRNKEIVCNKQSFLFSQCFLPYMVLIFHFKCTLKCRLQFV